MSSLQVPLLPNLIRRANPFADLVINLADAAQPEVVQVIARRKRLHRLESGMFPTFGEDETEDEVIFARVNAEKRHAAMEGDPRLPDSTSAGPHDFTAFASASNSARNSGERFAKCRSRSPRMACV